jgi:polysaccharide deacetylase 2 family uncharacterized protein YibQ
LKAKTRLKGKTKGGRRPRPLSSNAKTALLFYLAFAVLLLAAVHWSGARTAPAVQPADHNFVFDRPGVVDLVFLQDSLEEAWRYLLAEKGLNSEQLLRLEESRLMVKRTPRNELRWVRSISRLELPPASDETLLVDLGWEWKRLLSAQGLTVRPARWGLTNRRLWVRLASEAQVRFTGDQATLPCAELTIIQPLTGASRENWNWRGLIPEPFPELKPTERPPTVALKPKPSPKMAPEIALSPQPAPKEKAKVTPKVARPQLPPFRRRAKAALIIDDVGFVRGPADAMLKVPARLTWAFLPFTPYDEEYQAAARERGFEIILHLPLEPINQKANPGPGLIRSEWPEEKILEQLDADLAEVPGAVGMNNHMGSLGTSNERLMDILLKAVKRKKLFFVDSNTGDHDHPPVVEKCARKIQVPFARNQVFIDNSSDLEQKKTALRRLIKLALEQGEAVGIGHVREGTAEAIIEMLPEFAKAGVEIVPVSELVK